MVDGVADGLGLGVAGVEVLGDGVPLGSGVTDGVGDIEDDTLAEGLTDGDTDGVGEAVGVLVLEAPVDGEEVGVADGVLVVDIVGVALGLLVGLALGVGVDDGAGAFSVTVGAVAGSGIQRLKLSLTDARDARVTVTVSVPAIVPVILGVRIHSRLLLPFATLVTPDTVAVPPDDDTENALAGRSPPLADWTSAEKVTVMALVVESMVAPVTVSVDAIKSSWIVCSFV